MGCVGADHAPARPAQGREPGEDAALGAVTVKHVDADGERPRPHGAQGREIADMRIAVHRDPRDAEGEMRREFRERALGPLASGRGVADEADGVPGLGLEAGEIDDVAKQAADRSPEHVEDPVALGRAATGP